MTDSNNPTIHPNTPHQSPHPTPNDSIVYVGLDYHNSQIQVCGLDKEAHTLVNRSVDNQWHAIAAAVGDGVEVRAAIEACTGAADLAQQLVDHAGWTVHLAHAQYVEKIKGSPDKSDYSDARLLADLSRVGYVPRVWLAPEKVRELRTLVSYRQRLADTRRKIKQRIGAILRDHRVGPGPGGRWTKQWLAWTRTVALPDHSRWVIDEELDNLSHIVGRIKRAEDRITQTTKDDELMHRLLGESGVGLVTAATLRAAIGQFDRFRTGKQLARYCGLSPRNASSGQRQITGGLINEANKRLRATLIELSHRLIRMVPRWKKLARQLHDRGKPGSVVTAAIANRWVRGLYHRMQPMTT